MKKIVNLSFSVYHFLPLSESPRLSESGRNYRLPPHLLFGVLDRGGLVDVDLYGDSTGSS